MTSGRWLERQEIPLNQLSRWGFRGMELETLMNLQLQ